MSLRLKQLNLTQQTKQTLHYYFYYHYSSMISDLDGFLEALVDCAKTAKAITIGI